MISFGPNTSPARSKRCCPIHSFGGGSRTGLPKSGGGSRPTGRRERLPPASCCERSKNARERWPYKRNLTPRRFLPLRDGHVIALGVSGVELTRAADLLLRVLDHFLPLRDPADGAGDREQNGEHCGREAERL